MSALQYLIVFSVGGGLLSLVGGLFLLGKGSWSQKFGTYATPFAAGALLAAVFFDLLPEGVEVASPDTVFTSAVFGILVFFIMERGLHFFHHHRHGHNLDSDKDPNRFLVIAGDTLHNAVDGVVIAAGFLVSIPTGIATTLAVVAHEIPQEIGDFGLLLSKGMSRTKVVIVNILTAFATVASAVITYLIGSSEQLPLGILLGVSAGFLLYIAMSDIIPTLLPHKTKQKVIDLSAILLFAGVVVVAGAIMLAHDLVPHDDNTHSESSSQHAEDDGHHEASHDDEAAKEAGSEQ
jgi:zinc and cadmium transporter